ncbi:unnamed protein product [Nesidiocoris tenuis]|uniref:Uncharacterized protein n=1 Tax=Nesidiocoris tenuis TaxID=355587 RepID=A0A6H5GXQ0_9HEMI|nr:unnamed protein product [Nesidiocoris tenuis]
MASESSKTVSFPLVLTPALPQNSTFTTRCIPKPLLLPLLLPLMPTTTTTVLGGPKNHHADKNPN